MGLGVSEAAEAAQFLAARPQHADRTQRFATLLRLQRGGGDDRAARGVVDRAGRQIPRIEVAADQHRRQLGIAAGQFADHVARGQSVLRVPGQRQRDAHRLAQLGGARDQVGIGVADRAGRDRGDAGGPVGRAGVRIAVVIGPGRADHRADCALAGRDRRAGAAHLAIRAVARAVLVGAHGVVDEGDLARQRPGGRGREIIERVEIDYIGLDPGVGRVAAVAERGDGQLLRDWRGQHRGIGAAHIAKNRERFDRNVDEAQLLQPRLGPVARRCLTRGAGQPLADLGGEARDHIPRHVAFRLVGVGCGEGKQGDKRGQRADVVSHETVLIGGWRARQGRKSDCARRRCYFNKGAMPGSAFAIARWYAGRAPMRARYAWMFGNASSVESRNARLVVRQ